MLRVAGEVLRPCDVDRHAVVVDVAVRHRIGGHIGGRVGPAARAARERARQRRREGQRRRDRLVHRPAERHRHHEGIAGVVVGNQRVADHDVERGRVLRIDAARVRQRRRLGEIGILDIHGPRMEARGLRRPACPSWRSPRGCEGTPAQHFAKNRRQQSHGLGKFGAQVTGSDFPVPSTSYSRNDFVGEMAEVLRFTPPPSSVVLPVS